MGKRMLQCVTGWTGESQVTDEIVHKHLQYALEHYAEAYAEANADYLCWLFQIAMDETIIEHDCWVYEREKR